MTESSLTLEARRSAFVFPRPWLVDQTTGKEIPRERKKEEAEDTAA